MKQPQHGFTLIEVMVALVIVAILAAIGWPIMQNYELKNRRTQAVDWLLHTRLEMERCASNNSGSYVNCDVNAPPNVDPVIANKYPELYYNVAIAVPHPVAASGAAYLITATELAGDDADCVTLTIDDLGNKGYTGASPNTIRCWGSN